MAMYSSDGKHEGEEQDNTEKNNANELSFCSSLYYPNYDLIPDEELPSGSSCYSALAHEEELPSGSSSYSAPVQEEETWTLSI